MKGIGWAGPVEDLGMEQVGEEFDAVDEAGTRAGEVGIGVDGIDATAFYGRQIEPAGRGKELGRLFQRLVCVESAEG